MYLINSLLNDFLLQYCLVFNIINSSFLIIYIKLQILILHCMNSLILYFTINICYSICKELVECNIKHSADESKMDEVVDNDSILDFKSPESKIIKPRLSEFNKFNIAKQKRKTTLKLKNSVNQKEMKFEQHSEEIKNLQKFQPTIESSFFKSKNDCANKAPTTNAKVALVCPLCFKTFKDSNCHLLHMKMCATKNNISTRKLLDALELQKHQEDERKSLGLPAAPVIPVKKKSVSSRNVYIFIANNVCDAFYKIIFVIPYIFFYRICTKTLTWNLL